MHKFYFKKADSLKKFNIFIKKSGLLNTPACRSLELINKYFNSSEVNIFYIMNGNEKIGLLTFLIFKDDSASVDYGVISKNREGKLYQWLKSNFPRLLDRLHIKYCYGLIGRTNKPSRYLAKYMGFEATDMFSNDEICVEYKHG